jgi:hypothetical protein
VYNNIVRFGGKQWLASKHRMFPVQKQSGWESLKHGSNFCRWSILLRKRVADLKLPTTALQWQLFLVMKNTKGFWRSRKVWQNQSELVGDIEEASKEISRTLSGELKKRASRL